MSRTIFLRLPLDKQKLFLLVIAVICLVGYIFLRRTNPALEPSNIGGLKHISVTDQRKAGPVPSLKMDTNDFYLNGKPLRILSGAIHYFRVVPEYWRDRLLKLKAVGLNTVETYVAWNLHEEVRGQFDFDGILNIRAFIELAHELDLYVIVRPGPYICSEWDFGGLPSWLLHDPDMEPRSMYSPYIEATEQYFKKLLPMLVPLQFCKGGPIIAFQIENEYGNYYADDVKYMEHLKSIMIEGGIKELLFTSDNTHGLTKRFLSLSNVLETVNFGNDAGPKLRLLKELQSDKPTMVAEFWDGWFDHWGEMHHTRDVASVTGTLEEILKFGSSVNLYMFHGGTNFGFMNGANFLQPTITSYDYDAPLSEPGDITPKYTALRKVLKEHSPQHSFPKDLIAVPENSPKKAYGKVKIERYMPLAELLQYHTPIESDELMPMEFLNINNGGGQGYGFILYQTESSQFPKEIMIEKVLDRAQVLLGSLPIHTYDASLEYKSTVFVDVDEKLASVLKKPYKLEILVENMGRTNIGWEMSQLRKGISGKVKINGQSHTKLRWKIFPLELKPDILSRIREKGQWSTLPEKTVKSPALYQGTFTVDEELKDTFLYMKNWTKGVCFINGHNLGRYWDRGPQETLYVPAPWLKKGQNELIIFELHSYNSPDVSFTDAPIFKG